MRSGDIAQSVLAPASVQASSIHHLWVLMLWTTTIVCVVVLAFIAVALFRSARLRSTDTIPTTSDQSLTRSVWAATVLTAVILFMLLIASIWTGRGVESVQAATAVTIN